MRTKATFWGLLFIGLLLGGCGPAPVTGTPAPPATNPPAPTASPTQTGPDLAATQAAAVHTGTAAMALTMTAFPTPTATPIVLPSLTPDFQLVVETPLADLPPGEILLLWDRESRIGEAGISYSYITWDGGVTGPFFYMAPASAQRFIRLITIAGSKLYFSVGTTAYNHLIYEADLSTGQLQMFNFEGECGWTLNWRAVGDEYLTYFCPAEDEEGASVWYFVDLEDWRLVGRQTLDDDMYLVGWHPQGQAVFAAWYSDSNLIPTCVVDPVEGTTICRDLPYKVIDLSPNGAWLSVSFPHDLNRWGIIPFSCLSGGESADCELTTIRRPDEWQGEIESMGTTLNWSPDSRKLLLLDVWCPGYGSAQAWVWLYDVEARRSQAVAHLDGCYDASVGDGFWSSDGDRFVLRSPVAGEPLYVLDFANLGASYFLPAGHMVNGVFTIP